MTRVRWLLASRASPSLRKCLQAVGVRHLSHPSHTSPRGHPWGPWRSPTPGWTSVGLLGGVGLLPFPYKSRFRVVVVNPSFIGLGPQKVKVLGPYPRLAP